VNVLEPAADKDGHAQCTGNTSHEPGTVCGTARRPHFSLAFISVTVQLRIKVFLVISVYFNLGNILPKSGTFPPGTPCIYITEVPHHWDSQDGILSTETRLRAGQTMNRCSIPSMRNENFSLLWNVQMGSGAHATFYSMGTKDSLPRSKACGTWRWPLTSIQRWG